jgi:hypothetical protein
MKDSLTIVQERLAASEPYVPPSMKIPPPSDDRPPFVELGVAYARIATETDHAELKAAADEFEKLQAAAHDLSVTHQANKAREVLRKFGIDPLGDETFRLCYLERRASPAAAEHAQRVYDLKILQRLEAQAEPVIRRVQQAALEEAERRVRADADVASDSDDYYQLSQTQQVSPNQTARRNFVLTLKGELVKPIDLSNTAFKRDALSLYVGKPV